MMRHRATAAALGITLVLVVPAQAQIAGGADDHPEPTTEQLAAAVRVWDPSRSIRVWDPSRSVTAMESMREEAGQTVLSLDSDILFAFGADDIPRAAAQRLSALVGDIPRRASVSIEGHTDSIGDDDANLRLSERRARAVAAVIRRARGDLRLDVSGYGEAQPVEPNEVGGEDNPEGRAANRRVEVRYGS
jgi:OmpA-OmpF porin, OOP family